MAEITITIQAASDSIMTENNVQGGTPLLEGDARKVYGLPNITSRGLTGTFGGEKTTAEIQWIDEPRWDEIKPPEYSGPTFTGTSLIAYRWAFYDSLYAGDDGGTKPNPTTTAFQLRCESISHEFTDNVTISPIPAFDNSPGQHDSAGTPGQLNNIVLALGMRTEIIKLAGVLVDTGLVTASNPRRQILLNIARMQHYKTGRGGQGSGNPARWGGKESGLLNWRSYPCLRIFDANRVPGFSMGKEPSGDSRQYRGIIKDFSFRMEGGRPDHWFWNMSFAVISNEHSSIPLGDTPWLSKINRIRLVDDNDGEGDEVEEGEDGYFEIRCSQDLVIEGRDGETTLPYGRKMRDGDIVYISATETVPTLNGYWKVVGVNLDDKTFIIKAAQGDDYGEETVVMGNANNEDAGGSASQLKWNEDDFIAANAGHVSWGSGDNVGTTPTIKV